MRKPVSNPLAMTARALGTAVALLASAGGGARAQGDASGAGAITCEPPKDTSRTLLVDWEPADRAALETAAEGKIAVAHYDGCTLELLDDCLLNGEYLLEDSARSTGGFTVRHGPGLPPGLPIGPTLLS